jgi:hypothetical protein
LQEWQDQNGGMLAFFNKDGALTFNSSSAIGGALNVYTSYAGAGGIYVRGSASQSANLQEWQNSSGSVLANISSGGTMSAPFYASVNNTGSYLQLDGSSTYVSQRITTSVNLIVKGMASQTANLQEWQNSAGTVLASIGSGGVVTAAKDVWHLSTDTRQRLLYAGDGASIYKTYTSHDWRNASDVLTNRFDANGGQQNLIQAATTIGLIVKAAASQTANLQEWQNSSGSVLTSVNSDGRLWVKSTTEDYATLQVKAYAVGASAANFTGIGGGAEVVFIKPGGTTQLGLAIRGVASQTADLQQWQNSAGTVNASINSSGVLASNGTIQVVGVQSYNGVGSYTIMNYDTGGAVTFTNGAANKGLVVRGAASQTANLQEWQSSTGEVGMLFNMGNAGDPSTLGFSVSRSWAIKWGAEKILSTDGGGLVVTPYTTDRKVLVVKGVTSQTANLQEWQNSSGSVLVKIAADGRTTFPGANADFHSGGNLTVRGSDAWSNNASTLIGTGYAGGIGLIVNAVASQTADLQQWRNSAGSVLAKVDAYGYLTSYGAVLPSGNGSFESAYGGAFMGMKKTSSAVANPGADIARIYLVAGTTAGTLKLVVRAGASGAETTILDNIPQ